MLGIWATCKLIDVTGSEIQHVDSLHCREICTLNTNPVVSSKSFRRGGRK